MTAQDSLVYQSKPFRTTLGIGGSTGVSKLNISGTTMADTRDCSHFNEDLLMCDNASDDAEDEMEHGKMSDKGVSDSPFV